MEIKISNKNGRKQYIVDGKIYNSFEELPDNLKILLQDKDQDGVLDIVEGLKGKNVMKITQTKYVVDGKECDSLDDVHSDVRKKIERSIEEKERQRLEDNKLGSISQTHVQDDTREYCPCCSAELPKKKFFGFTKCKFCGTLVKKKK